MPDKKGLIKELVEKARNHRPCGPSDDPDEQTFASTLLQLESI